ncbi:MAG: SRPBCC domain-containing protein [Actinomycetia bacterium]|nr:SRPBCC domain-containing protein [Actinomycetes bacterium]MCH9760942.1 SRPBCC domain-containing protein [Actinomycetes bacterium]
MTAPQCEFTLVRDFDAPRDLVYRVWTEPQHMAQWLMPRGVRTPQNTISQDLRVGGLWRWTMIDERDGIHYPTVAQFREIVEPERLVFTWGDATTQPALITVTLTEHAGGTRLTLHLTGPTEMLTDKAEVREGWNECLDSLQQFLTRRVEHR